MKRHTINLITLGLLLLSVSSCNYLDVIPDNVPNIDHAFADRDAAEKYLFTCYNRLPRHGSASNDPAMLGGHEMYTYHGEAEMSQELLGLINGTQSSGTPLYNCWNGETSAQGLYQAIRVCNTFLEKIDEVYDLKLTERKRWVAEVKFLKAYYHFYLMQMYGAIPIVDRNMEVGEDISKLRLYREPLDSCIHYVNNLINEAIPDLPLNIANEATELGRITQPIALAVRAKLWMLAASPLFNGNPDYAHIKDERGVALFKTTEDPTLWLKAAQACKAAIDTAHLAGAELYRLETDPMPLNDVFRQELTLRMTIYERWNKETIWGLTTFNPGEMSHLCMPPLTTTMRDRASGRFVPTFDLVESYYSNHGVPIEEDKDYDYNGRYSLQTASEKDKWYIKEGEETVKLHFDREPRFYASIGFDRGIWFGQGKTDINNYNDLLVVKSRYREKCGFIGNRFYSITGYFSKKLVDYQAIVSDDVAMTQDAVPFPSIRLADLYLLYAEALNETKQSPDDEVFEYIDKVRERAGLDGVEKAWTEHSKRPDKFRSKEGMREIIHRERLIELAMEGHAMWDLRGWKEAEEWYNRPVRGWNINKEEAEEFYKQVYLLQRVYSKKNYLWPIKDDEIRNNPKLIQNYGW